MILLAGMRQNLKRVGNAGIQDCSNCHNSVPMGLYEHSKEARAFFVPLAKWGKEYYMVCPTCSAGVQVDSKKVNEALRISITIPDDGTAIAIWNAIDKVLISHVLEIVQLSGEERYIRLFTYVKSEIPSGTYREEHLDSVLASYIRHLQARENEETQHAK